MIQKILSVAVLVLVIGTGCSQNISIPQSTGDPSESGSVSASSESENSAPSAPAMDFVNDAALHRNILVNYGADITTGTDGKPLEAHQGASLFLREDWDSEHPMEGFGYFGWNFGQMWNEGITDEERQTKYAHPSGKDNMGWFFPQALYEERAQQYFDVGVDELRSITEYDAENEGYHMQAGFGMGGKVQVELHTVEQKEDVLELHLTLVYEGAEPARSEDKILRVRMAEDGGYKYIGCITESSAASIKAETAVFALGTQDSEEKTLQVDDTIGDWVLSDLKITYADSEPKIRALEASFTGEVTLNGTISRNGLVELGYDFLVAEQDVGKMPRYLSPVNENKGYFLFMLDIPDGIANTPTLEHGEKLDCKITISEYRFTFAYRTAPSGATVTKIELL